MTTALTQDRFVTTGSRVTLPGVLRSEWTKFRSLRSSYWTLIATVVATIGLAAVICGVQASQWPHQSAHDRATFSPVMPSLAGIFFGQLGLGVLGVLLVSGEYSTGSIRSSMTAVPKRLTVLWAKVIVFGVVSTIAAFIATFVAFFIGQALLSSQHIQTTFGQDNTSQRVTGAALYLIAVGILGMALGALLRNTAAGISTLVGLIFVLPILAEALPSNWTKHILPYLPANAGQSIWADHDVPHLGSWTGFGVLCAYVVLAIALAAYTLRRRDV